MKEPHFDDRRVVQRAQPVVPLAEIRSRRRNRMLLFLSAAFVVSMMLGSASALLTVRIKQMRATKNQITQPSVYPAPETTPAEPESATAELPNDSTIEPATDSTADATIDSPPAEESETAPVMKPIVVKKQEPPLAQRPRVVGRDSEALRSRDREVQPNETEQLEQIREAVLYDQWQERRMRRAARRERRNRNADRDLSHVDEIFEGPRRRERP